MRSLFLRLFLWFCAAGTLLFSALAIGYVLANPDQLPFAWPSIGRGAIILAGRIAVQDYERGGKAELGPYLQSVHHDTGIRAALLDSAGHILATSPMPPDLPASLSVPKQSELLFVSRHIALVRIPASSGAEYTFVANVPRRERSGFWSRTFLLSFVFTSAVLCYFLARHITSPVVHLRTVTSQFSGGALSTRVTAPAVLNRSDEIGGLAADFNRMASRIESLMRSQQRLIADVSHELRSPLTRLSLALGLIERRQGSDIRPSLTRMKCELERLNSLIAQLLTLSRLECLEQPLPIETVDLRALVQGIAADADFESTTMDCSVRLLDCDSCSIRGSRDMVRSAVENVVRNALKYTASNTVVTIRLLFGNVDHCARIVVCDSGPGIPPAALDHVFEPFYRVDDARDRRTGGVGLGLAIAQRIVTLHGGSIRASNHEDGGLEMQITLPSAHASDHPDKS